jgi:hypothetical protein
MPAQKVLQTKYKEGQIERNRGAAERNQAGSVIRSELTALPRRLATAFSGGSGALFTSQRLASKADSMPESNASMR